MMKKPEWQKTLKETVPEMVSPDEQKYDQNECHTRH